MSKLLALSITLSFFTAYAQKVTLQEYCPTAQVQYKATCFAYATAYTAYGIEYNLKQGVKYTQPGYVEFSSGFVASYLNSQLPVLKRSPFCGLSGTAKRALDALKETGTTPEASYTCDCLKWKKIPEQAKQTAAKYKVKNYQTLQTQPQSRAADLAWIKHAINQNHPVVIAFYQTNTIYNCRTSQLDATTPTDTDQQIDANHVICILDFIEDTQTGKSWFLVKNNFEKWGDGNGFCKVPTSYLMPLIKYAYYIELN